MHDLPALAPFFFVEPDYDSQEATSMRESLDPAHYGPCCISLSSTLGAYPT
jgi:hypothetical protein